MRKILITMLMAATAITPAMAEPKHSRGGGKEARAERHDARGGGERRGGQREMRAPRGGGRDMARANRGGPGGERRAERREARPDRGPAKRDFASAKPRQERPKQARQQPRAERTAFTRADRGDARKAQRGPDRRVKADPRPKERFAKQHRAEPRRDMRRLARVEERRLDRRAEQRHRFGRARALPARGAWTDDRRAYRAFAKHEQHRIRDMRKADRAYARAEAMHRARWQRAYAERATGPRYTFAPAYRLAPAYASAPAYAYAPTYGYAPRYRYAASYAPNDRYGYYDYGYADYGYDSSGGGLLSGGSLGLFSGLLPILLSQISLGGLTGLTGGADEYGYQDAGYGYDDPYGGYAYADQGYPTYNDYAGYDALGGGYSDAGYDQGGLGMLGGGLLGGGGSLGSTESLLPIVASALGGGFGTSETLLAGSDPYATGGSALGGLGGLGSLGALGGLGGGGLAGALLPSLLG